MTDKSEASNAEEKPEKLEQPEKPAKAEQPAAAAKPEKSEAGGQEKKRRKISRMTVAEVEAQLKTVKEKMGNFHSLFARHLLARKSELIELTAQKK